MASDIYPDRTRHEAYRDDAYVREERRSYSDVGGQIATWLFWAIAFAFWVFSMSIDAGIMRAIAAGGPNSLMGGIGESGSLYFIFTVLGFIALGIVIAWGAARYATRDKRLDRMTEAATARIYDDADRGVRPPYGAPGTRGDEEGSYRPV